MSGGLKEKGANSSRLNYVLFGARRFELPPPCTPAEEQFGMFLIDIRMSRRMLTYRHVCASFPPLFSGYRPIWLGRLLGLRQLSTGGLAEAHKDATEKEAFEEMERQRASVPPGMEYAVLRAFHVKVGKGGEVVGSRNLRRVSPRRAEGQGGWLCLIELPPF